MGNKQDLILPWQQDLPEGSLVGEQIAVKKYQEELSKKGLKKVLLIDDSMRAISTLNKVFSDLGCNTFVSFDGYAAINSLLQTEVDLMILDMMMDGLDGSSTLEKADELLRRIREAEGNYLDTAKNRIPVVIYTGMDSRNILIKQTEYFQLVDVWQKPISYSKLFSKAE
ncbi:MAG: response regulator, partial [Bdellovibrionota bacterium]|nr:response regulator [Bdellovibrionota bacterium]